MFLIGWTHNACNKLNRINESGVPRQTFSGISSMEHKSRLSIINKHINPSKKLDRSFDELTAMCIFGMISANRDRASSYRLYLFYNFLSSFVIFEISKTISALLSPSGFRSSADPARTSCNHHYLILQRYHGHSSFLNWDSLQLKRV